MRFMLLHAFHSVNGYYAHKLICFVNANIHTSFCSHWICTNMFFFFCILFTEFNLAFGPLMESLLICLGSRLTRFNKEEFKSNALHVVTCSSFCKWLICTKTYLLCQCEYVHIPLCFDNGRYTQVFFRFENALDMHKHVTMWEG